MTLRPDGNGWITTFEYEDEAPLGSSGPAWPANATTITFTGSDGDRWSNDYTLEGKLLTMTFIGMYDGDSYASIGKWRKID